VSAALHARIAVPADSALLAGVDPARRDRIDAAIARSRCWAAELDGRVVGYAIVSREFFERDFIELLVVDAAHRRRGAGDCLLSAIERAVRGDRLFTSTNESNAPMRALLAKRGWLPSGRIENLDDGDPELVFVKLVPR
jgi:GNAT superfamily N-acetyltransferase